VSGDPTNSQALRPADFAAAGARWLLAAAFIYMGATKALHPEEFLKLVRQYGVTEQPPWLNLVAATLPWIEIVCGLVLAAGVAVRGTALLLGVMLVGFTALIAWRARGLGLAGGLPFCAVAFDCGCGAGVVPVCRKLVENTALVSLAAWLAVSRRSRLCLRHAISAPR
jgi:uncharacterized membrane protein YphA (DoxX/SURF4 family)